MVRYSIPLQNLGHLNRMLSWYKATFGHDAEYNIQAITNVFIPEAIIQFRSQKDLTIFLLKFGETHEHSTVH